MLKQIKQYKSILSNSKEGKTVFANFGYLSLLQIAGYVFPLITMPYLARVIGVDGFGKIAFASVVVVWFQTIADWGFNLSATRDVAQNKKNKEKVSEIFSNVLWARCFLTLLSGLLLAIIVSIVPYLRENAAIIFVTFLLVPGHILFPDWFFQALEKMKYTTIFNLLIKLLFTVAVFIFIKDKDDYIIQPLLNTIGFLICGVGAMYIILKNWGYTIHKPRWKDIVKTIKDSTDVFLNNLMPNFYNSFSVMLLGFFGGSSANGIYNGGDKFPSILNQFLSILSRAFYPFLSRRSDKHSFYAKLNIGISLIGALFLIVISPWLIRFMLGEEFENSIVVMQILSISIFFIALCNTYGNNYLIIYHQEKPLRNLTLVSSVIGLTFSIPLVYYFSYIGAACTVLLCRALLGVGSYVLAKKHMKQINTNV